MFFYFILLKYSSILLMHEQSRGPKLYSAPRDSTRNISSKWYCKIHAGVRNSAPCESARNISVKSRGPKFGSLRVHQKYTIKVIQYIKSRGPKFGEGVRRRDIKSSCFMQNDFYCQITHINYYSKLKLNRSYNIFHWYYLGVRNSDPRESAKNITSKWYLKNWGSEFRTVGFIPLVSTGPKFGLLLLNESAEIPLSKCYFQI